MNLLPPTASGAAPPDDVRLRGFADLATVARAHAWVDRHAQPRAPVVVPVGQAIGRVLAAPLAAAADHPPVARAGIDGYAVRAADTVGASAYDPVQLRVVGPTAGLTGSSTALVSAGAALPPGADAVVGFDVAQPSGPGVDVIVPAAPGAGVDRAGAEARAGSPLAVVARPLRPHEVALLATLGIDRVSVVARPRVRLVVAGPKDAGAPDAHGPMLQALVERDGGEIASRELGVALQGAVAHPPGAPVPDLVIVTGRTGAGEDDVAAPALAEAGELALHGIALRPGGSAGLGLVGGAPVVLLPGDPLACLVAYELVAGRLVRRLAGRDPALPHRTCEVEVGRKLVSVVGFVEVNQVRLEGGRAEPLGVADFAGLPAAARAGGFVVVPAPLEGYAPGARVTVHLY